MAQQNPFYVTTAIAYPNGQPHIGHAYEYISTDAIARFQRLDGRDVLYLTGTDEHGQKVQQTAEREGVPTAELARRNSDGFQRLQDALGISYDRFIRTTDADHKAASRELWRRMEAAGDIYLDAYSGWYSVRDEAFFTEEETTVGEDGVRVATATGTPVEWTEESSYFFRLSTYAEPLLAHYEAHPEFIGPDVRRNEVASFVRGGLRDLSISRTTFDWGVKVPDLDGDVDGHVMYVWVDALTNYLTGAGFASDDPADVARYDRYWPADLHIIGKDIIRFHCVYWPAFLMSAGIPLPKRVFAHGFLFNKGQKMSKSVGNVVDPAELIAEYGLDAVRYFLLREVPYGQDGSYSHEAIAGRINADLAGALGNLAQRVVSLCKKYFDLTVPTPGAFTAADAELLAAADALLPRAREAMAGQQLHLVLEAVWEVLAATNRYISAEEPWKVAKTDLARAGTVLYVCAEVTRIAGVLLQPTMPAGAARLLDQLGVAAEARDFAAVAERLPAGTSLPAPTPVFPRYEAAKADA